MTKKERKALKARQRAKSLARNIEQERVRFPGWVTRSDRGMFTRFRSEWVAGYESGIIIKEILNPYIPVPQPIAPLSRIEANAIVHNTGYKPQKSVNSRSPLGQKVLQSRMKGKKSRKFSGKKEPFRGVYSDRY